MQKRMAWKNEVERLLSVKTGKAVTIVRAQQVGGGSINDTQKIETTAGLFFVKLNSATRYPQMFAKEAKGLTLLRQAGEIAVPEPLFYSETERDAFLVLHYIESGVKKSSFWEDFGTQLAALHRHSEAFFGLDHDNYIGSLPQSNRRYRRWCDFFREERLEPMVRQAYNARRIDGGMVSAFDRFFGKLDGLFPEEPPALIHGDLWGGNFMVGSDGEPVIIDPAVYYGHREMDLGMSELFGGFDRRFYEAYHLAYPLEPGWQERLDYCNLYPLMVHVNLFGGGYAGSVSAILRKF